jgi:hypothetical protein
VKRPNKTATEQLVAGFAVLSAMLRVSFVAVVPLGIYLGHAGHLWPGVALALGWAFATAIHAGALALLVHTAALRGDR